MKIGILSDSHKKVGRTQKVIELLVQEGASALIHAGDLVTVENLKLLEESSLPYYAVFGNNDAALLSLQDDFSVFSEPHLFTINETTFSLMHHPFYLRNHPCDVVVFGHTHETFQTFDNAILTLNPGEACARDTSLSQAMMLEIATDAYIVTQYSRSIGTPSWGKTTTKYNR